MIEWLTNFLGTTEGKTGLVSLAVFIIGMVINIIVAPKSKVVWSRVSGV